MIYFYIITPLLNNSAITYYKYIKLCISNHLHTMTYIEEEKYTFLYSCCLYFDVLSSSDCAHNRI